jgi:hypothetical protein
MSGMFAVSKPPTMSSDGLRNRAARVNGQKVCHDAHHPTTTSARRSIGSSRKRLVNRPGCRHISTGHRSASTSRSTRMNEASLGHTKRMRGRSSVMRGT